MSLALLACLFILLCIVSMPHTTTHYTICLPFADPSHQMQLGAYQYHYQLHHSLVFLYFFASYPLKPQAVSHDTRSFLLLPPLKPLPLLQTRDSRALSLWHFWRSQLSHPAFTLASTFPASTLPLSPQWQRPHPCSKCNLNCITHSSCITHSCFWEPTLSVPVCSSPNQCLIPMSLAQATLQANQLGSPFIFGLYTHSSLPIYPQYNGDSWLNYVSSFVVHQGCCCLWVNVTQDSRYQPQWSDLNDNAAHSHGSCLLFCFTWSGTLLCHDVLYSLVNSFALLHQPACAGSIHTSANNTWLLRPLLRFLSCCSPCQIQTRSPSWPSFCISRTCTHYLRHSYVSPWQRAFLATLTSLHIMTCFVAKQSLILAQDYRMQCLASPSGVLQPGLPDTHEIFDIFQ